MLKKKEVEEIYDLRDCSSRTGYSWQVALQPSLLLLTCWIQLRDFVRYEKSSIFEVT